MGTGRVIAESACMLIAFDAPGGMCRTPGSVLIVDPGPVRLPVRRAGVDVLPR